MNRIVFLALMLALIPAALWGRFGGAAAAPGAAAQTAIEAQTQAIVAATADFLNSLNADEREKVQFAFTPQKTANVAKFKEGMGSRMTFVGEQYGQAMWSNFPVGDVPRPGLSLGSLSAAQREAAMHVLAQENDEAFALLNALDKAQRQQAILNYRVPDLVLGPGHDGETILPEGLKASAMNERQRAMLLDLISEWAGIINDAYATPRMNEIKAGLDDTYFAWSGPTTHEPGRNGASYHRIQGPKLVIEFAPQEPGGDLTMHVHTIYRDPTNDYGRAFSAR